MAMESLCEGAKALTQSAPSWSWWIGLNAGEQAAWAAALIGLLAAAGGFAAAWASFRAAKTALNIASAQASREDERDARRAEVHAAFIIHELGTVYRFVDVVLPVASALGAVKGNKDLVEGTADAFEKAGQKWQNLIDQIDRKSVAQLPDECAAATAGAISEASSACVSILASVNKFRLASDIDALQRTARLIEQRCLSIRKNLKPYLVYAKTHFNADVE